MSSARHLCESLTLPHALPDAAPFTRLYVNGWRCARHTPNAEKGQPEVPPGPGWPIHRAPRPDEVEPTTEHQEQSRDH
ncbi:hypothetical protein [Streptomyces sp. NEAU-NA10]|uniref:hypothetical protein n=1 Tax=Streptomyces sp. NEAU-NA10 TaxID=3416050 RepID=UPI003CC64701